MADLAATRAAPSAQPSSSAGLRLQRKCACGSHAAEGGECESCKKRVQRKGHTGAGASGVPSIVHGVLGTPGRPLDASVRRWMEPRFGHDFSGVRVHTDSQAAESARSIGALAYAVGQHVVFDHRQYAPDTPAGRHLLAHELAHTIQDPGSGSLHPSLELGNPSDANELAADRAADAVTRGEKVTVAPIGGGVIRRQVRECKASDGQNPSERLVSCPGDGDYRVTLSLSDKPARPETRATVNPGWNSTQIWLNIGVCRGGTQVTIKPIIDLPKALGEAVANAVAGSPLLKGVSISPGLTFTIVQNGSYTFTVGPTVKLDQQGVGGVGGSAELKTKDVDVKADVTYDPRSKGGFLNFTFSGGSAQPKVDCHDKGGQYAVFSCERISHVAAVPEVQEEKKPVTETRYVFFEYATDKFRHDLPLPVKDVQDLTAQGYKVASIRGFTSPEGPRGKENMPKFEGNHLLAIDRAKAAKQWLQNPDVCKSCDLDGVAPEGEGELPPVQGKQEPEPKGRSMEKGAVDEFLGNTPGTTTDPMAPKDPVEREKFQKLPFSEQRERAFKLMRRAAIVFRRMVTTREAQPGKPAHDEYSGVDCPPSVVEAAQRSFGINITTGAHVPSKSK
ncbi:MAG TPA: DUF4157 domain-containing protein [Dyella sp.]|uniref:eCIS core domain-containing protein n=1 Tax=Dyella sp. TaxID=1869338 RepID=UPI002F9473EC